MSMPALGVCQRQPANKSRQFHICVRCDNQIPDIVYDAKRQTIRPGQFDCLKHHSFKRHKIVFAFKNRQPCVRDSALDKSIHLPTLALLCPLKKSTKPAPPCQKRVPDTVDTFTPIFMVFQRAHVTNTLLTHHMGHGSTELETAHR